MHALYGIHFSGDHNKWSAGCTRSNIWIAAGFQRGAIMSLKHLMTVQDLPGDGAPFQRLSNLLNSPGEGFAAIDAPFSLPAAFLPDGPEAAWAEVRRLAGDRQFCRGAELVGALGPDLGSRGKKVLRKTEKDWRSQKVNVRSTVWSGPRGGAPFTAACMTLLSRHKGPVWPIRTGSGLTLIEAFPAAQLRHWGLPHIKYNGEDAAAETQRNIIIKGLQRHGIQLENNHFEACLKSADALDSVICLFAAAAVANDQLAVELDPATVIEGHIAVHA